MSDAAQNVEIEDVLASIRRLVSDEVSQELARMTPLPRNTGERSIEPSSEAQDAQPALVLTPALRVHTGGLGTPVEPAVEDPGHQSAESQQSATGSDEHSEASLGHDDGHEPAAEETFGDTLAAAEDTEENASETFSEPYVLTQDSLADTATDTLDETDAQSIEPASMEETVDAATLDAKATGHEALLEAVAAHVAQAADAASRAAEEHEEGLDETETVAHDIPEAEEISEAAETDAAQAEEPASHEATEHHAVIEADVDAPDLHDAASADEAAAPQETLEDAVAAAVQEEELLDTDGPYDDEIDPRKTEATTLEAKIAKLESMIGARDESWEADSFETITPQTHVVEDIVETPLEWEDATVEMALEGDQAEMNDASAFAGPMDTDSHAPLETQSGEDGGELFESQDLLIDEDMLRDVVSSIVREELKGALGERITRNVRKLVRREIHRALANNDLR